MEVKVETMEMMLLAVVAVIMTWAVGETEEVKLFD